MTLGFEKRQSQQDMPTSREPLVDINVETPPSAEPGVQLKPRRKRLSDMQEPPSEPTPEPKIQRRHLSEVAPSEPPEPTAPPQVPSGRPRLSVSQTQTAVAGIVDDTVQWRVDDGMPATAEPETPTPDDPPSDTGTIQQWIGDLRSRQSLPLAAAGGLLAAGVGAMVWAIVSVATNYQIGWMAVGVGFLVGGVVRIVGRGLDKSFGYLGAALALFACLLGNYLTNCMFIAREVGLSITSVLTQVNLTAIPSLMIARFHPVDLLFYGLAIYEGYRFSFRRITEAQVRQALGAR